MTACFKLQIECFTPHGKKRRPIVQVMHVKILVSGVCFIVEVHITHSLFFYPEFSFKNYWREATSSGKKKIRSFFQWLKVKLMAHMEALVYLHSLIYGPAFKLLDRQPFIKYSLNNYNVFLPCSIAVCCKGNVLKLTYS